PRGSRGGSRTVCPGGSRRGDAAGAAQGCRAAARFGRGRDDRIAARSCLVVRVPAMRSVAARPSDGASGVAGAVDALASDELRRPGPTLTSTRMLEVHDVYDAFKR